jgi:SAM-dependent methyltransferase
LPRARYQPLLRVELAITSPGPHESQPEPANEAADGTAYTPPMGRGDPERDSVTRMREDWEARAAADPLYHIAATQREWSITDFYASGRDLVRRIVDPALARLDVEPAGQRVLEIGCGMGRLFEGLSERFGSVSGIDISATMVAKGREQCPIEATWYVGDGCTLSGVADSSIDHVLSFEVFQHIPDRTAIFSYLAEIPRVLVPGGTFQVQLRKGSDSKSQAVVRAMPRPLRVASAKTLNVVGALPVIGDIDSWLGAIVPSTDAVAEAERLGFADISLLPDEVHAGDMGYWMVGRLPA